MFFPPVHAFLPVNHPRCQRDPDSGPAPPRLILKPKPKLMFIYVFSVIGSTDTLPGVYGKNKNYNNVLYLIRRNWIYDNAHIHICISLVQAGGRAALPVVTVFHILPRGRWRKCTAASPLLSQDRPACIHQHPIWSSGQDVLLDSELSRASAGLFFFAAPYLKSPNQELYNRLTTYERKCGRSSRIKQKTKKLKKKVN